jgi:hypothetical protein
VTTLGGRSVCNELWPVAVTADPTIRKEYNFFKSFLKLIRTTASKSAKGAKVCHIFIASTYETKKIKILQFMQKQCDSITGQFSASFLTDMKTFIETSPDILDPERMLALNKVKETIEPGNEKQEKEWLKKVKAETSPWMQFASFMKSEAEERGFDALAETLSFDQYSILQVCNFCWVLSSFHCLIVFRFLVSPFHRKITSFYNKF